MLDLDGYGSDSSDEEAEKPQTSSATSLKAAVTTGKGSTALKLPPASNSISLSQTASSSKIVKPPITTRSAKSKKIIVEAPKAKDPEDDLETERPVLKKPRSGGSGPSTLFSMLPAPKKSVADKPQRVLGGGRLDVVYIAPSTLVATSTSDELEENVVNTELDSKPSTSLLPPSLLKGKSKGSQVTTAAPPSLSSGPPIKPSVDFFSLGSTSSKIIAASTGPTNVTKNLSAAPKVEEFRPPSPTMNDPYPGYYQLSSGKWAMHDLEYYKTYTDRWSKEYEAQIKAYEKGLERGFEGAEGDATIDLHAVEQLDAARKEREEKKAMTKHAALESERKMPNMTINPQKIGGLARTRHQLSTLLTEAYMNREALEEQIAQAKRNRKEAGNKYGTLISKFKAKDKQC